MEIKFGVTLTENSPFSWLLPGIFCLFSMDQIPLLYELGQHKSELQTCFWGELTGLTWEGRPSSHILPKSLLPLVCVISSLMKIRTSFATLHLCIYGGWHLVTPWMTFYGKIFDRFFPPLNWDVGRHFALGAGFALQDTHMQLALPMLLWEEGKTSAAMALSEQYLCWAPLNSNGCWKSIHWNF